MAQCVLPGQQQHPDLVDAVVVRGVVLAAEPDAGLRGNGGDEQRNGGQRQGPPVPWLDHGGSVGMVTAILMLAGAAFTIVIAVVVNAAA